MKVWPRLITFGISALLVLSSCTEDSLHNTNGPVKVLLPWMDGSAGYKYREIEIKSLTNISKVRGPYARFYYQPLLTNSGMDGISPDARLVRNTDGVYMPADFLSTQMFTIYAHLEELAELDASLGVETDPRWPRDVGVTLPIAGDLSSRDPTFRDNAFYFGKLNALLLLPYRLPDLPVAVNGGVLAHEHFHGHFYRIVQEPLEKLKPHVFELPVEEGLTELHALQPEVAEEFENQEVPVRKLRESDQFNPYYINLVLRALNEGLADFWGLMYSGQKSFIGKSLPTIKNQRTLSVEPHMFHSSKDLEMFLRSSKGRGPKYDEEAYRRWVVGMSYKTGTNVGRLFRGLSELYVLTMDFNEAEAQRYTAGRIILALKLLREDLESRESFSDFSVATFLNGYLQTDSQPTKSECNLILRFIPPPDRGEIKKTCGVFGDQPDAGREQGE